MLVLSTWTSGAGLFGRPAEHPWRQHLAGIARGEQQALARLYDESSSLVYSVALKILENPADAEEISLDVFMQVWRRAADYSPDRGSPTAWLVMLARSRALDRLRSQQTRRGRESAFELRIDPVAPGPTPEEASWIAEQRDQLRTILDELGPEQRTVIELAFYEGLSHSDLAQRLKLPIGTIKTRIRLGMSKLRQRLTATPEVA